MPKTIDLSSQGPFGGNQQLHLKNGVTLISGCNGRGKTTIALAVLEDYESWPSSRDEPMPVNIRRSLILHDQKTVQKVCTYPSNRLVMELMDLPMLANRKGHFEKCTASNIGRMLMHKAKTPGSKFWGMANDLNNLKMTICDGDTLRLYLYGTSISHLFLAQAEMVVVSLALIAAVRRLVSLEAPLIVDSTLGYLDATLAQPCFAFLHGIGQQVIILDNEPGLERLNVVPDYRLVIDPFTGKMIMKSS